MGVSSSELLSSSSDSSDWISSTMERRGPGRAQEVKSHQSRHKPTEGEREPTYLGPVSVRAQSRNLSWSQSWNWSLKGSTGPTAAAKKKSNQIKEVELLALTRATESVFYCSKAVQIFMKSSERINNRLFEIPLTWTRPPPPNWTLLTLRASWALWAPGCHFCPWPSDLCPWGASCRGRPGWLRTKRTREETSL